MLLSEIQTEISSDPIALGYAPLVTSGDIGAIAALLNTARDTILIGVKVPLDALFAYVDSQISPSGRPLWISILAGQTTATSSVPDQVTDQQVRDACAMSSVLRNGTYQNIDMSLPAFANSLMALVLCGIMSTEQKDATLALGKRAGSRAEQLWGSGESASLETLAFILRNLA